MSGRRRQGSRRCCGWFEVVPGGPRSSGVEPVQLGPQCPCTHFFGRRNARIKEVRARWRAPPRDPPHPRPTLAAANRTRTRGAPGAGETPSPDGRLHLRGPAPGGPAVVPLQRDRRLGATATMSAERVAERVARKEMVLPPKTNTRSPRPGRDPDSGAAWLAHRQ